MPGPPLRVGHRERDGAQKNMSFTQRFFYFFIFQFRFLQKYIFVFEIYGNKKFREKFAPGPLEDRSPGSGAAGRPAAGRPSPPPLYKGLAATPPLI